MNKFFYRIILLIPLFFSQISVSLSFKYNAGENLVERIREKNTQEKRIKLVLDSIRKHNNKIAQNIGFLIRFEGFFILHNV